MIYLTTSDTSNPSPEFSYIIQTLLEHHVPVLQCLDCSGLRQSTATWIRRLYIDQCDRLWVATLPGWDKCKTVQDECDYAESRGKRVIYYSEEFLLRLDLRPQGREPRQSDWIQQLFDEETFEE